MCVHMYMCVYMSVSRYIYIYINIFIIFSEHSCKTQHPEEFERFKLLVGTPNKKKKAAEPTAMQLARWNLKKRRLVFAWFASLCATSEHCFSFRKALDALELSRSGDSQIIASQMGVGMSKTSKKEDLRQRSRSYDADVEVWMGNMCGMKKKPAPTENDWDSIGKGLVLLFDDDFFSCPVFQFFFSPTVCAFSLPLSCSYICIYIYV